MTPNSKIKEKKIEKLGPVEASRIWMKRKEDSVVGFQTYEELEKIVKKVDEIIDYLNNLNAKD